MPREPEGVETVLVDHGSTDGTLDFVRERFPEVRVIEQENKGLGAGLNAGMRAAPARYHLLINSDAWLEEGALERLVAFADAHPDAAVVAPARREPGRHAAALRARLPDPLSGRDRVLLLAQAGAAVARAERVLRGRLRHDETRPVEWSMGSCFLVRREAADQVGLYDEDFFMFWRGDRLVLPLPRGRLDDLVRARRAGDPRRRGDPRRPDVQENVRNLVRWFAKHRGPREATRVRRLLIVALRLRGLVFPGERGRMYRDAARAL